METVRGGGRAALGDAYSVLVEIHVFIAANIYHFPMFFLVNSSVLVFVCFVFPVFNRVSFSYLNLLFGQG